jgi:hypothetical protein
MTITDQSIPNDSSAWNWPAEWAVERTFWREVATRTVAGILTIVVLAVPGLIYAAIFGLLAPRQVIPILIGIVLFALVLLTYVLVLRTIRRREIRKIKSALERDETKWGPIPTVSELIGVSAEERDLILSVYSQMTQQSVRELAKSATRNVILTTLAAVVASLVVALAPAYFR